MNNLLINNNSVDATRTQSNESWLRPLIARWRRWIDDNVLIRDKIHRKAIISCAIPWVTENRWRNESSREVDQGTGCRPKWGECKTAHFMAIYISNLLQTPSLLTPAVYSDFKLKKMIKSGWVFPTSYYYEKNIAVIHQLCHLNGWFHVAAPDLQEEAG